MRRVLTLIITIFVLLQGMGGVAQRVTDSSFRTVAYIKSDGTIQDASFRTIGHIKSDGTVQDGSFRTIGHIKFDGTVQDASYRTIGYAKDIPTRWAAIYFFFRD